MREPESFLPLKSIELLILIVLESGDRHGYGIRQEILDQTDGTVAVEAGNLYRHIRKLESERLLRCIQRDEYVALASARGAATSSAAHLSPCGRGRKRQRLVHLSPCGRGRTRQRRVRVRNNLSARGGFRSGFPFTTASTSNPHS